MKIASKISLRWRITLLTAVVLTVCSVTVTVFSIYNAQEMLYPALEAEVLPLPAQAESELDDKVPPPMPAYIRKRQFDFRSIYFCLIITGVGTLAAYFFAGRATIPVRNLNQRIAFIDEYNLSERLPEAQTKDEIGEITRGFNHMLDRLEEAFKRQKRFTASAAHELKTPLATMKAGIQVVQRDGNATLQDYMENAEMMVRSVDRLAGVVNDLLLIASAEENRHLTREEIDLDTMFEAIFEELLPLYEKKNILYIMDLSGNRIYGNSSMLYRAFYNLVENAYKYNCLNGEISITAYRERGVSYIQISDTGKGIPEEYLPFIFEPFYRVDASRSRKIAGAGLGLSLVKTIIERHGGNIAASSNYGNGSTFTIELPDKG